MPLSQNYFALFGLPVDFAVERRALDTSYRELQQRYHPDRAAAGSDSEVRLAVQQAAAINQAYSTLKSPLLRAQYLLELAGVDANQESHITRDGMFLMEQIELRERMEEIADHPQPFDELESLRSAAEVKFVGCEERFVVDYAAGDHQRAIDAVAKLQFFSKLLDQLDELEQDLEEL